MYLAWRSRRADAVASCRLMWAEFRGAVMALQLMLKNGEWMNTSILQPAVDTWQEERKTISRATKNAEFKALARGIAHLLAVQVWEKQDEAFGSHRYGIERATAACIDARVIAYVLGESSWSRWKHRRRSARGIKDGLRYEPDVPEDQAGVPNLNPHQ